LEYNIPANEWTEIFSCEAMIADICAREETWRIEEDLVMKKVA